ncbi:DUF2922 domain-containing protein [Bacillus alveayuensis]|jgi:hypothetical protein|uniref:DUF2922 domain-containing protein n=1 Tax=Aeribacillus alveayuensis TaxID=279215 RepID=A0ABT9VMN4_9BACI|nr:DUF2922 domain-containing protein [Bacillus alveayuensis]MDQ0162233.1 hypothetical protein [Bacillus alveayuensis]
MEKTLELQFLNEEGKLVRLTIEDPKDTLTEAEISLAMDSILSANVFTSKGGRYVAKKGARVIERQVTEFTIQ